MDAYRGLAVSFRSVQDDALGSRPDMTDLPAREALIEFMIRISLGQSANLIAPKRHMEVARKLRRLIRLMQQDVAIVEDAAEATIRACAWLTEVKTRSWVRTSSKISMTTRKMTSSKATMRRKTTCRASSSIHRVDATRRRRGR